MDYSIGEKVECITDLHPYINKGSIGRVIVVGSIMSSMEVVFLDVLKGKPIDWIYAIHIKKTIPKQLEFSF